LDKKQSWKWIINNRLPLFLRSDIYSEYKICKKFASYISERESDLEPASMNSLESTIRSLNNLKIQEIEEEKQGEDDDLEKSQILPTINKKHSALSSSQGSKRQRSKSISYPELQSNPLPQARRRSLYEESEQPLLHHGSRIRRRKKLEHTSRGNETFSSSLDTSMDDSAATSQDIAEVFSSKSGMTAFWKFLKGTAGERNWLFWLDAERVKYFEGNEQTRYIPWLVITNY